MHVHKTIGDFKSSHANIYIGLTKPAHTLFDIGFRLTRTKMEGHLTVWGFSTSWYGLLINRKG